MHKTTCGGQLTDTDFVQYLVWKREELEKESRSKEEIEIFIQSLIEDDDCE